ncbi:methyltransferase [Asticcacaulis taihuensis]|uniref:Methyltransferase small domain-containing protein n=1 Tax=Asticcacaulis taihuensis TaxID=260084 RepID=A0A1G4PVC8_9CAUL|nr:methyltransferase [Asticcacaulis taihuensis]SCW36242.1 Methyltransferase small domain-containing protein [Asticcacaulis taihuensis]
MQDILHYTPEKTAKALIAKSRIGNPHSVADFCVGDGSLIRAAAIRWPEARLFINDVDTEALAHAAMKVPSASLSSVDFLSEQLTEHLHSNNFQRFSTILLNPPFANVGAKRWRPRGIFSDVPCSRAMAFLLTAVDHIEHDGEVLAILPASTIHSHIDETARNVLGQVGKFRVLSKPALGVFPRISATTYMVRVSKVRPEKRKMSEETGLSADCARLVECIVRGNISTKKSERVVTDDTEGMVHTTSIKNGKIVEIYQLPQTMEARSSRKILENYILIPRVGKIDPGHIVMKLCSAPLHLSDCLFAIRCDSPDMVSEIHARLIDDFTNLKELYKGTGAPYLTRDHLAKYMTKLLSKKIIKRLCGN